MAQTPSCSTQRAKASARNNEPIILLGITS
ncbi:hypothetical protein A2U01_0083826 [Trifolium medium]|uniref:Uncharacterized protein n=1 Tax=Trifolium medium TaxID=97028 RepID=A0A392TN12_9FABA|nr:hypothetical protein [Trifolium medium]